MKKVKVLSFVENNDFSYPKFVERTIELWLKTEEGQFIKQYTKTPLDIRIMKSPSDYNDRIEVWATLEEKYETFWRLKFK